MRRLFALGLRPGMVFLVFACILNRARVRRAPHLQYKERSHVRAPNAGTHARSLPGPLQRPRREAPVGLSCARGSGGGHRSAGAWIRSPEVLNSPSARGELRARLPHTLASSHTRAPTRASLRRSTATTRPHPRRWRFSQHTTTTTTSVAAALHRTLVHVRPAMQKALTSLVLPRTLR